MKHIAVIGAGAAGCFAAIEIKRRLPDAEVVVFEAGKKPLSKVAVTGGGRCNFTNTFAGIGRLEQAYPRGAVLMKRALRAFSQDDAMAWFDAEGIPYVVQDDNCVFPQSQDAMQVVRTFEKLMRECGVSVRCGSRIDDVRVLMDSFDAVLVASGGGALKMLEPLEIDVEKPVPSLFTFNIEDEGLRSLMGTPAPDVFVGIAGTSFKASGTLLVTDWGVSGPAVLKLSSYAARYLSECGYRTPMVVNWTGWNEQRARDFIAEAAADHPRKMVANVCPDALSTRLWKHIMSRAGLRENIVWAELGAKGAGRLVSALIADNYPIAGKCRFKAEFVTCGGVSLSEVSLATLESRKYPGLFFAGEVLDVDAITGGFNLQAAWSTAMVAARSICERFKDDR